MASPIVEYWDEPYVQKFSGDSTEVPFSLVDTKVIYDGLDMLKVKVAGDNTGLSGLDLFNEVEAPDIRQPFATMVRY